MFEKLRDLFNSLPHDKALHGYYGMIAYSGLNLFMLCWYAVLIVFILAVALEEYDRHKANHTSDKYDAITTIFMPVVLCMIETLSMFY